MKFKTSLVILVLFAGCIAPSGELTPTETPLTQDKHTQDEAVDAATEYITTAPTFVWDGMEETLKVEYAAKGGCPTCYDITITFDSRHGGYGDRTGMMVTQMITTHTAVVLVRDGNVESAVLDGIWDEMNQNMLSRQTPPPQLATAEGA